MNKQNTTVITGASRGIGLELAKLLVKKGDHVIGIARSKEPMMKLQKSLKDEKGRFSIIVHDLSDPEKVPHLIQKIKRREAIINSLVINAAASHQGLLTNRRSEDLQYEMSVNYLTPLRLICACKTMLQKSKKKPQVMVVGSLSALTPFPGNANYAASKAALLSLCRSLHVEWKGDNIAVKTVLPGPVETKLSADYPTKLPKASPQSVAKQIDRAMASQNHFQILGLQSRFIDRLHRLAPNQFDSILRQMAPLVIPGYSKLVKNG